MARGARGSSVDGTSARPFWAGPAAGCTGGRRSSVIGRSRCGTTQGGVRWKTYHPVGRIRLNARHVSGSHSAPVPSDGHVAPRSGRGRGSRRAVWKIAPRKSSQGPAARGPLGSLSGPGAAIEHLGPRTDRPRCRVATPGASSSHSAAFDWAGQAEVSAHAEAVGAVAQVVAQLGLERVGARPVGVGRERVAVEVRGDVALAAGYVLAHQVPPTSASRSNTTKSSTPVCLRRIAMPRPPKPAPRIATRNSRRSAVMSSPRSLEETAASSNVRAGGGNPSPGGPTSPRSPPLARTRSALRSGRQ